MLLRNVNGKCNLPPPLASSVRALNESNLVRMSVAMVRILASSSPASSKELNDHFSVTTFTKGVRSGRLASVRLSREAVFGKL